MAELSARALLCFEGSTARGREQRPRTAGFRGKVQPPPCRGETTAAAETLTQRGTIHSFCTTLAQKNARQEDQTQRKRERRDGSHATQLRTPTQRARRHSIDKTQPKPTRRRMRKKPSPFPPDARQTRLVAPMICGSEAAGATVSFGAGFSAR